MLISNAMITTNTKYEHSSKEQLATDDCVIHDVYY